MGSTRARGRSLKTGAMLVLAFALPFSGCGGATTNGLLGNGMDAGNPPGCQGSTCAVDSGVACTCTGPEPKSANYLCTDGTTGGPFCDTHSDGTCSWSLRTCTPATACETLGCNLACLNGFVKDKNGCNTCTCAPAPDAGMEAASSACSSDSDCPTGDRCGFATADACSATGQCFPVLGAMCNLFEPGCACDGTAVNVACTGLPDGYVSKPLLHTGACVEDAGTDAGDCCPTGYTLYSCKEADGGKAMACHNPRLGCVSSLMCGEGCDHVVTGRCAL